MSINGGGGGGVIGSIISTVSSWASFFGGGGGPSNMFDPRLVAERRAVFDRRLRGGADATATQPAAILVGSAAVPAPRTPPRRRRAPRRRQPAPKRPTPRPTRPVPRRPVPPVEPSPKGVPRRVIETLPRAGAVLGTIWWRLLDGYLDSVPLPGNPPRGPSNNPRRGTRRRIPQPRIERRANPAKPAVPRPAAIPAPSTSPWPAPIPTPQPVYRPAPPVARPQWPVGSIQRPKPGLRIGLPAALPLQSFARPPSAPRMPQGQENPSPMRLQQPGRIELLQQVANPCQVTARDARRRQRQKRKACKKFVVKEIRVCQSSSAKRA